MTAHGIDLSVVVPVYKEKENIRQFLARITPILLKMAVRYEIIFVSIHLRMVPNRLLKMK